jgi:hypothetical protein
VTQDSYLIYARVESLSDISQLLSEGIEIKGKFLESYKVVIGDLQPEKLYVYQVGNKDSG